MTLYESLAQQVQEAIRLGIYRQGEKVPSLRKLARLHQVSDATALAAYRRLEAAGWLEARPQSGFIARLPESWVRQVPTPLCTNEPCAVSVTELAVRLSRHARHEQLVSFGAAVPHPQFLPLRALRTALVRAVRKAPEVGSRYSYPPGEESLRVRIAQRSAEAGCQLSPDDIFITNGCQEAINLALRAVAQSGDIIAIESPAFFGTLQAIESLGMRALEIPCTLSEGMSLEALEFALDRWPIKAVMLMSNFSNPTGGSMPDASKARLVRQLAARGVPLIEDDIYGDLTHGPDRPRAAKAWDAAGNVLLCSSFSKTIAPGYRVGWIAPGRWRNAVEHLKFVNTMATATLPQLALAEYLGDSQFDRHLRHVRRVYADNLARMRASVMRHFPPGTRVSQPCGGFLLWVELPQSVDTLNLYERALRTGISFSPGRLFTPRDDRFNHCLRLAGGLPWDEQVEMALKQLGDLARSNLPRSG